MKKILIFFSVLLLTMGSSHAQIIFGVKAGVNITNQLYKDDIKTLSTDFTTKTGFHLGGTVEILLLSHISFESGLFFSTKGYNFDDNLYKCRVNLNYFEIPMNGVYTLKLKDFNLLFYTGPYVGYAFSGKIKSLNEMYSNSIGAQKELKIDIGYDKSKDMYKPLELGLNIGTGIEMNRISLRVQYGFSLSNIAGYSSDGTKIKNRVWGISAGYKFGG